MKNINNKNKYFNDLFERLKDDDNHVYANGEEIESPEDLADHICSTITSNIQYDFGIDFNESDVIELCTAVADANKETDDETVFIDDVTGTLGHWLDDNLNKDIPKDVIDAINNAYVIATNYLCDKEA